MLPSIDSRHSERSVVFDHPKFDGVHIKRSNILAPSNTRIEDCHRQSKTTTATTLMFKDLSTLGCLPTVVNFPIPANQGKNTWKPGSFKGTDQDLLEIERVKKMQDLHVLDIIRRESDIEDNRIRMLKPSMGLPPDSFRVNKLQVLFKKEREAAQEKVRCVILDHEAFLNNMYSDHNREFDKHVAHEKKVAKKFLQRVVKLSHKSIHVAAVSCAAIVLDRLMDEVMESVQERYMVNTVRPKHRQARMFLRNMCMQEHLKVWATYREKLLSTGIIVHQVVFPKFRNQEITLDITVHLDVATNQLIVAAVDTTDKTNREGSQSKRGPSGLEGKDREHWTLNVPMVRRILVRLCSSLVVFGRLWSSLVVFGRLCS